MDQRNYFIKLSGLVPENKRKEFEQTFRFVFAQMPPDCLERSLTVDSDVPGYYHFFSLWPTSESLKRFMNSQEYILVEGAFEALGSLIDKLTGERVDIKIFCVN